jgi:hypothetical protein
MSHVTKIAAVENFAAIWEYDPSQPENTVLGGELDVISVIRTIAIKVRFIFLHVLAQNLKLIFQIQASGQRIEYFNRLQIECGIEHAPLKIPLHSNIRWGTASGMLERAEKLKTVSTSRCHFLLCS